VRRERGHEQQPGRVEEADDGGDPERDPPRQPVGQLPGRQREQRQRQELGEADQPEVERVAVDHVHLPADRDGDHLRGQHPGQDRHQEERIVALPQQRWKALLHGESV
jgi:hypothetical protein